MTIKDAGINQWLHKTFSRSSIDKGELELFVKEMMGIEESNQPSFVYGLAKINSEAAFLLWQHQMQKRLGRVDRQIIFSRTFPQLDEGSVNVISKVILKPLAFRNLIWHEFELNVTSEPGEIIWNAAIVAGIKHKAYHLALDYASKRSQGGRLIQDWSLIQNTLGELKLIVDRDEALIQNLSAHNLSFAFSILQKSDEFVSLCMQVLGGAGYTEDFGVERLYRETLFLKNWPLPFKPLMMANFKSVESGA